MTAPPEKPLLRSLQDFVYWRGRHYFKKLQQFLPDRVFIAQRFEEAFGYELDLSAPRTFNEKMQWLKLYDRRPIHKVCADKYAVLDFITERWGAEYLIPTYAVLTSADEIDEASLPDTPFVIRPTHDQGSTIVIKDKQEKDWTDVRRRMRRSMRTNAYRQKREWQYDGLTPRILIQKALLDKNGDPLAEPKFCCFNGKVQAIIVDHDLYGDCTRTFYDRRWRPYEAEWGTTFRAGTAREEPPQLEQMIALSEKVAADFDFVRVDFYLHEDQIYFGEITFHPGSGFSAFNPPEMDREWGEMLKLTNLSRRA
ncbi:MAG: ATP-grasp fold amidoligase family protein [Pseudomonadota bacterium]